MYKHQLISLRKMKKKRSGFMLRVYKCHSWLFLGSKRRKLNNFDNEQGMMGSEEKSS